MIVSSVFGYRHYVTTSSLILTYFLTTFSALSCVHRYTHVTFYICVQIMTYLVKTLMKTKEVQQSPWSHITGFHPDTHVQWPVAVLQVPLQFWLHFWLQLYPCVPRSHPVSMYYNYFFSNCYNLHWIKSYRTHGSISSEIIKSNEYFCIL